MEQWQRTHVNAKIHKLVEGTIVSEPLLRSLQAQQILGASDLELIRCRQDRFEKAGLLYDIVQNRRNGYIALLKALSRQNQSGALDILMEDMAEHLIPDIKINFSGTVKPLSSYFEHTEILEIIEKFKTCTTKEQHLDFYFMKNSSQNHSEITLVHETIPKVATHYIPRSLSKRIKVNAQLFQAPCTDIFVFKNFNRIQLADLVKPNRIAASRTQLDENTCRFIFLEAAEDWEEILETCSDPTHLISFDEHRAMVLLESSTGGSEIIHQYLERPHEPSSPSQHKTGESAFITEDEFVLIGALQDPKSKGVCICDSPGMGKTLLLANLARMMKNQYPEKVIAFIHLNQLIEKITKDKIQKSRNSRHVREAVLKFICTSPVAQIILSQLLIKKTAQLQLFCDAFDEVPHEHIDLAKSIICEISKMPRTKLCVTSGRHIQHELEASLSAIAYDILPFSQTNKVDFLVNFWNEENNGLGLDEKRLHEFACYCLSNLQKSLNKEESDITGIPLQCRLLAQVYSKGAKRYAQAKRNLSLEESCTFKNSLPDIYRKFIELSFDKLAIHLQSTEELFEIKQYHIWTALQTLFPTHISSISNEFFINRKMDKENGKVLFTGLLEKQYSVSNKIQFIHRTFAEYFAAQCFTDAVSNRESTELSNQNILKFLFKILLMTTKAIGDDLEEETVFVYSVTVYFFNNFLKMSAKNFDNLRVIKTFSQTVTGYRLYNLLLACLRNDYANIFNLVKNTLEDATVFNSHSFKLSARLNVQQVSRLFSVATQYSSVTLLERLCELYAIYVDTDISKITKEVWLPRTLLATAIKRADYEMVQFFADNSPDPQLSLFSGVEHSYKDTPQMIEKKIVICELLLSRHADILTNSTSHEFRYVHLDLLIYLIRQGENPRIIRCGKTIAHHATEYMSSSELHQFYTFLIYDCNAVDLFLPSKINLPSPLYHILTDRGDMDDSETIKLILAIPEKVGKQISCFGDDLLLIAACRKHSVKTLITLIQHGVDTTKCTSYRQNTFLHLASSYLTQHDYLTLVSYLRANGYSNLFTVKNERLQLPVTLAIKYSHAFKDTLELFKESGVDFNSVDEQGSSLLMYAVKKKRSIDFLKLLIEMGVSVMTQNSEGDSFAHLIATKYSDQQYHDITKLIIEMGLSECFKIKNCHGETPLHYALRNLEILPETLYLLVGRAKNNDYGSANCLVDLSAVDSSGWSIVQCAMLSNRSQSLVQLLADLAKVDNK